VRTRGPSTSQLLGSRSRPTRRWNPRPPHPRHPGRLGPHRRPDGTSTPAKRRRQPHQRIAADLRRRDTCGPIRVALVQRNGFGSAPPNGRRSCVSWRRAGHLDRRPHRHETLIVRIERTAHNLSRSPAKGLASGTTDPRLLEYVPQPPDPVVGAAADSSPALAGESRRREQRC